jgi:hypothetical protein
MEKYTFTIIALGAVLAAATAIATQSSKAERRIRTIERRLALLLHHFGIDPNAGLPPSEQVRLLATDPGKKLQAIRLYSKETGVDVKTSAAVVAALEQDLDRSLSG